MIGTADITEKQNEARHYGVPNPDQMDGAVAALVKGAGKAAAKNEDLIDRLRINPETGEFRLLVFECLTHPYGGGDLDAWPAGHDPLRVIATVHPIAFAAALLASERNPEQIMRQRRDLIAQRKLSDRKLREASDAAASGGGVDATLAASRFSPNGWDKLPDMAKFALRFAYAVESSHPSVAAELVNLAREIDKGALRCPQRRWTLDL